MLLTPDEDKFLASRGAEVIATPDGGHSVMFDDASVAQQISTALNTLLQR